MEKQKDHNNNDKSITSKNRAQKYADFVITRAIFLQDRKKSIHQAFSKSNSNSCMRACM